jgi:aryl carrier-like protein
MYRTADRARHTLSGELEYLGRRDQQVKLHGHRIELQDIEACLHDHAGVQDAAVVLHKQETAVTELVAYYVATAGGDIPEASALGEYLRQRLPTYMLPSHFLELEQLPRTANGDLDRLALPVPSRALQPKEYVAARTPIEQALVRIWEQIFELERVSIHDNFFDLGGDSIVLIQIINRAQRVGLELSLRQTFEHPTIAELAPFVGAEVEAPADEASEQTQA